jgi:hypothetical protein
MTNLEQDRTLLEIRNLWEIELGEENEDTHLEERLGARHPINKPNTTPRQMDATPMKINTVPGINKQATCVTGGGRGARHPVNKPNSTPRQLEGQHQHAGGQDGRGEQHQHAGKPNTSFGVGGRSDWSLHLTGLVGWWRRVENAHTKQDEKNRKVRENKKKMSVAKLSFVKRFFPTVTNPTPGNVTCPNSANDMKTRKLNSVILSPATK